MLRRRIALLFDLNLNPFYIVKGNLIEFKDANDSIIFSVYAVLPRCTCIKSNNSSLSSIIVDLIADMALFNLENNLSGFVGVIGNLVRIFSNIWTFGKIVCKPCPFGANL